MPRVMIFNPPPPLSRARALSLSLSLFIFISLSLSLSALGCNFSQWEKKSRTLKNESNKSWGEAKLMVYVGNVCSDVLTPMKAPPAIASKRGKVVLWCFWSVSVGPKLSSIIHDISIATRSYYDAWLQR